MHEEVRRTCILECQACDELQHYIVCAPLWLLASEILEIPTPFQIPERLCINNPSLQSLQLLALCFQGYHFAKSLGNRNNREVQAATLAAMRVYRNRWSALDGSVFHEEH